MVAEKILGNIQDKTQKKAIIPVAFEWFELEKKRIKKTAEDGTEFGISIPEVLKEGDILGETESALYVVQIIKTRLIHIHVHKMQEMGRLGFELGNRHLSLKITEQDVYVPYDEPTFSYLAKLGFEVEEVTEAFTDFIQCKAHGHSHGHEHAASHTHSHGHEHAAAHTHAHGED